MSLVARRRMVRPNPMTTTPPIQPWSMGSMQGDFEGMAEKSRTRGGTASDAYLGGMMSFDPSQYVSKMGSIAFDETSRRMKDQLSQLAGRSVGQGRMDTGFYDEDQGEVVNRNMADWNSQMGRASLEATGMNLQRLESLGGFGERQEDKYTDMLQSERERKINEAREEAERKRKKKRGIGGFIGSALGAGIGGVFGGLGGAGLGAKVGGSIGGIF